ncbi:MAG: YvcK family protein [bacterium]|nr:YvcK family protein [bacterium]
MTGQYKEKKIVVIGGGTGIFPVLLGLKTRFSDITAVVTAADEGGSSGILREEFGILPPGDIRRALIALSSSDNKILSELFNYRFQEGSGLSGHSFGNLIITALERITGSFDKAVMEAGKILAVQGRVLPATLKKCSLVAELENGEIIKGETNIDIPKHDGRLKIKKVWLSQVAEINPLAKKAILDADAIIVGPGDLYSSLLPNLLVKGMKEALKKAKGKKIYFVNIMTKFGETNGFTVSDFVETIENYLGNGVLDYVVANKTKPSLMRFRPYAKEQAQMVEAGAKSLSGKPVLITADLLRKTGFIRHDPDRVAEVVRTLI